MNLALKPSATGPGGPRATLEPGRPGRPGGLSSGGSQVWEAHVAVATSSTPENKELLKAQQIGRGPAECQLGLQAGAGWGLRRRRVSTSRDQTELDKGP